MNYDGVGDRSSAYFNQKYRIYQLRDCSILKRILNYKKKLSISHTIEQLQFPQCTCLISHNAPFRTEMCTFLFWMVHYGQKGQGQCGICEFGLFDMCLSVPVKGRKYSPSQLGQSNSCWCLGPFCHQVISWHDIDNQKLSALLSWLLTHMADEHIPKDSTFLMSNLKKHMDVQW